MTAARPATIARAEGRCAAAVTIEAVNPLEHAREIKELFLAHQRPEFPDFFDRTYPGAVARGAVSWVGRDAAGRVVMHIACMRRRFKFGDRDVVAGLLANLMVATTHRSFFPALALINRLVRDTQAGGVTDFLHADPNEQARTLVRGVHFVRVGTLQRYVLPVCDARPVVDAGVRLFHAVLRVAGGLGPRATVVAHPAAAVRAETFSVPHGATKGARLAAYHDRALYVSRLQGYPGDRDWWLTCPELAVLVRGPDASGHASLAAMRWTSPLPFRALIPGLVAELRRRGCRRLYVITVAESDLGRTLRRSGFIPRRDTVPLFALPLTPLGEECARSIRDWQITDLDCDR
jgi:hypothetical protein